MPDITDDDLQGVLENDAPGVALLLADLRPSDVIRLQELEAAGLGRADVIAAINHFVDQQQAAAPSGTPDVKAPRDRAKKSPTAKQVRGEEVPDYLKPDYSGPLSIDLMERRAAYFGAQNK